jgi:hypothetical protein
MKSKFTLGAIAGASTLALSVPIVLQLVSAASLDGSSSVTLGSNRPVPSQACVSAMAAMDDYFLQNADAMIAAHKAATVAHKNALLAAAQLTDETARAEAVKKAQEDMRAAMKAAMDAQGKPTEAMDALKAACGDTFRGHGMMMKGPGMGMFGKPFGNNHHFRGHDDDDGDEEANDDAPSSNTTQQ